MPEEYKIPDIKTQKILIPMIKSDQMGLFGAESSKVPDISTKPKGDLISAGKTWQVRGDNEATQKFHQDLKAFPTHTSFMQSDHPMVEKVKALHGGSQDAIRDHFNKTVGRWDRKQSGIGENDLRMKIKHEGVPYITKEHWKVSDLPEEHKKEVDNYATPKDFHRAVASGEVSQGLLDYLKNYSFYSHHIDKSKDEDEKPFYVRQFYEKEGKKNWGDPDAGTEHHLQKWFKTPVSSNMKVFESSEGEYGDDLKSQIEYMQNKTRIGNHFPEGTDKHLVGSDLTQALADRGYYEEPQNSKQYKPDDKFDYAGTNWKVLRNGEAIVDAINDEGHRKQILKTDIENMPEHDMGKTDIHNSAFKKKLQDLSPQDFKDLGFTDEEMNTVRNHAINYENTEAEGDIASEYEDAINKHKWALMNKLGEVPHLSKENIKKFGFGDKKIGDRISLEDIYQNMNFPQDHPNKDYVKNRIRRHLLEMEHNANPEGHHDPLIRRTVGKAHDQETDEKEKGIMYKMVKALTQNKLYLQGKSLMININENKLTNFEKALGFASPLEIAQEKIRLGDTINKTITNIQNCVLNNDIHKSIIENNFESLKKASDKYGKVSIKFNTVVSSSMQKELLCEGIKMMKSIQEGIEEFEITEASVKAILPNQKDNNNG